MPYGDGTLSTMLASKFKQVVGTDASGKYLALAKLTPPNAELHEALIKDFATTERFNTIKVIKILEHVVDSIQVLRKAVRSLIEEGVLLIHVPNAIAINRHLAVLLGTLTECEELSPFDIHVVGYHRLYSPATL